MLNFMYIKSKIINIYTSFFGHKQGTVHFKKWSGDFPGGAVVRNPPANAGDMGSRANTAIHTYIHKYK